MSTFIRDGIAAEASSFQDRITAMLLHHWLHHFQGAFGGFPKNYCVIDCETTGFDAATDLILNIGHCIVEDGKLVDRLDAFLDWTRHPGVNQDWLYNRMEYTRENMAKKGREYKMHYGDLAKKGGDPIEILNEYHDLVVSQQKAKYAFVMHNGYNFDAPRLCGHFQRWLGKEFDFGSDAIWDTGMIVKASQLNSMPDPRESMRAWAKRVGSQRTKGVFWALDSYVVPHYGLVAKYNLQEADAHGGGYDAYVTHLLFETFREIAASTPPELPFGTDSQADDDTGGRYGHLGG